MKKIWHALWTVRLSPFRLEVESQGPVKALSRAVNTARCQAQPYRRACVTLSFGRFVIFHYLRAASQADELAQEGGLAIERKYSDVLQVLSPTTRVAPVS